MRGAAFFPRRKMPANEYLLELLEDHSIIFYVAIADNLIVGGLTAHLLPSTYFRSAEVYIYDLAVKTLYQRKGIGSRLIASLQEYCKNLGMKEIFVQADVADQYAIDFYAKTGGIPERVIHFSYDLNNDPKY